MCLRRGVGRTRKKTLLKGLSCKSLLEWMGEGAVQKKLQAGCLGFWEDTLLVLVDRRKKQVSWILESFVLEWDWQGNWISGFPSRGHFVMGNRGLGALAG